MVYLAPELLTLALDSTVDAALRAIVSLRLALLGSHLRLGQLGRPEDDVGRGGADAVNVLSFHGTLQSIEYLY